MASGASGGGRSKARRTALPDRTAVVAHEVRGPLGVVTALAEMLLDRPLADADRRLVELIRLAGAHVTAVAEDLVAEASLGADRFRVVPAPFDPADTLRAVAALWSPLIAGDRLTVEIAADLPRSLVGDEGRVRQILFNLISNASKAADRGRILLAARRDGEGVALSVADDGPGLPEDFASEPFADAGRPLPGAGLGLWISGRIAAALAGRLTLENRPEGGAVATLVLPAVLPGRPPRRRRRKSAPAGAPAADPVPAAAAAEPAEEAASLMTPEPPEDAGEPAGRLASPLAGLTALVVDDSAVSRLLMRTVLRSFDMTVETAANGSEAVDRTAAVTPDVILLDWALVRETGADVLDRLATAFGDRLPPVVTVSACGAAAITGRTAGHVVKPFTPRELHTALEEALVGARLHLSAG